MKTERGLLLLVIICLIFFQRTGFSQCDGTLIVDAGPDKALCPGASGVAIGLPQPASGGTAPYTYSWFPATGLSCANCPNPTFTGGPATMYTLTVYDADSVCVATDQVTVTPGVDPVASFNTAPVTPCANIPVQFTNTSSGTGLTFAWSFNDPASGAANTSALINPIHIFNAIGSATQDFSVTLLVTNADGCSASVTQPVTVMQTPGPQLIDPGFDFRNCGGNNYNLTVYDNSTVNPATNYIIQWGDGTPDFSAAAFPGMGATHTYTSQEVFDLAYIVTGTNGCVDTTSQIVTNITNPAVGAANPGGTQGCSPLMICFPLNNFASNHPSTTYIVDFGDGSPIESLPHPPPSVLCHNYVESSCVNGAPFTFKISASNFCDVSEATITPIRVSKPPIADFVPPAAVCAGAPASFTNTTVGGYTAACSGFATFQWDFGDGSPILTVNSPTSPAHTYANPGTYTVTMTSTNATCGGTVSTQTVCVEAPPVPDFTVSQDAGCVPFSTQATDLSTVANTCNVTYNWSVIFNGSSCSPTTGTWSFAGGTNASSAAPQFQFSTPGTYTVRLSLTNSCGTFTSTRQITAQGPPQATVNPLSTICAGQTVSPSANINTCYEPADIYAWTLPGGSPAVSADLVPGAVTYPGAGTFSVNFEVTNQCGSAIGSTSFVVKPLPPPLNPTVNTPLCVGATAQFNAATVPGATYTWSGPNGFSSALQNPQITSVTVARSGTYSVYATLNGCQGPVQTVELVVNPLPVVSAGNDFAICRNAPAITLTGTPSGGTWAGTGITPGGIFTPSAVGVFSLTYTYTTPEGCPGSDIVVLTVNPLPAVNAGPDISLCNQPVATALTGTPSGGTWSGTGITNPSGQFTPFLTGSFPVVYTVTNAAGCSNRDTIVVTVVNPDNANAGIDQTICSDAANIQLSGLPAGGTWTGTGITGTGLFDPAASGTFPMVYTFGSGTCLTRDTMLFIVNPLPAVDAGAGFAVCENGSASTHTGAPSGGTWSGTGITPAGLFDPAVAGPGTHTLTYTFTDPVTGCTNTDNLVATVNSKPLVAAGSDLSLCSQPIPVTLAGSPSGGTWTGMGITNPAGQFTPAAIGAFPVVYTVTNANGCTNKDTLLVSVVSPSTANAGADSTVCIDAANVQLTGLPAGGTWAGTGISTAGLFDPVTAGSFNMVYALGSGTCIARDTMKMIVNPLPVVNAGTDFPICLNAPAVNLTATPANGTWTGTGVSSTGTFDPAIAGVGTISLTYTYTDPVTHCDNFDVIAITVNPLPLPNAGPDLGLCNQPIAETLTGTPSGGTWSGTGITNPSGQFTPFITGSFPVVYTVTSVFGCTSRDTAVITVSNPANANAGADSSVCIDAANVQLMATPAGGTWTGTGVTSGGLFDPVTAGTFPMVYTFGSGTCLTRDTMNIVVNPLPVVNAGTDFVICLNAPAVNLTATPANGTWTGTGVSFTGTFDPAIAGTGTVSLTYTYTDPVTHCDNFDVIAITVNPLPLPNAGPDLGLCNQPIAEALTGTPSGGTWSGTGITNPSGQFTPFITGSFPVVYAVTSVLGCTNRDTAVITVSNPANANAGVDSSVCIDAANIQLTATPAGGTWTGTGVTSGGLFDPVTAGTFPMVYTFGSGTCLTRDTMNIVVNPLPVVNAGTDFAICLNAPAVNLTATPANGTWTGTGVSFTGTFDPAIAGTGTVSLTYTYTDPVTHCDNFDVIAITVNPLPLPNAGPDLTLCNQPIAEALTGTPAGGMWSGTGITNPSGEFTPFITGNFPVVYAVTSGLGCTGRDTMTVIVVDPANANAGADLAVCIDAANVQLTGIPAAGTWSGTGITSGGFFDPVTVGTFTMTYTFGSGTCLTTDDMDIVVNPLPVVNAGTDFSICIDAPAAVLAGSPAGGTWSGTGITGASGAFDPLVAGTGAFPLTYSYTDPLTHCQNSDVLNVTVNPLPVLNAGNDTTLCDQPIPVAFTGSPAGGIWSGQDVTAGGIFTPSGTGTIVLTYTVTDPTGCDATDQKQVLVVSPQQANAGADREACIFSPDVLLSGLPAGGTWAGTGITSGGVFTPNTAGNFPLVYTYGAGNCLTRDTMIFTVHALPVVNVGVDREFCLTDDVVDFAGNPLNGVWSGTGITDVNAGTFDPAVAAVGSFAVIYTYTNPVTTCVNKDTLTAIVHALPVPDFTYNAVVCAGSAELFSNTSTGGNTYAWDFGDAGTDDAASPNHTYTAPGFYDIQLTATSVFGCIDSITQNIEVREPPVADFTLTPDSSCAPVLVSFDNNSTGTALAYAWNFGNGQTSILADPANVTYQGGMLADTTYSIQLSVTNFCGTSTHTETVIAMPKPRAVFGTNFDVGCSPYVAEIADNSIGLPDTYFWNFGDGSTSTNPDPLLTHAFVTGENDTVYTIMLVVGNECGTDTAYHDITVLPNQVNAFFNTNVTSGCVPLAVDFTQFSTGGNTYNWNFGDGNTSNAFSPSHTFTTVGTFTVSLAVNDGCSFDTITVDINVHPSPTVNFSSTPDSVCINVPFTFTNTSMGLSASSWDFGDGQNSVLTSPDHTYTASGTYQVTLTGTSTVNSCTASVTKPVIVSLDPSADFTADPISGCAPLEVSFTNTSTNMTFDTWDFGDGNSSGQFSPVHTFQDAGAYAVKLLVENANGCQDSVFKVITVHPVPMASFTVSTTDACFSPASVTTVNTSTDAVNYSWNLGNGNTSALTNPVAVYNAQGTYTIQLIATNAYGCSDTYSLDVVVHPTPSAAMTISEDTICLGELVTLASQSTFADSIVWLMGDGNELTGNSITYEYGTAGTYDITVIAYGPGGCGDTLTLVSGIVVHPTPIAGFDYVNIQNPDPLSGTVEYTNTSIGGVYYTWDFGNGVSSHEVNPTERYNEYGDFGASLIAMNEFGCSDTIEQLVIVDFFSGLFVPNAMYPGHPDFGVANFMPKGTGLATYEILIYDDWGNLIWESTAIDGDGRPTGYWNGTFNGQPVQQDAYVWKVTATFRDTKIWKGKEYPGGKFKKSGTVTVIR